MQFTLQSWTLHWCHKSYNAAAYAREVGQPVFRQKAPEATRASFVLVIFKPQKDAHNDPGGKILY